MTSEYAQCSSRSGFRIFKISREVRVLKQSQSVLFSSITQMIKLFVFTCVMNVKLWSISRWILKIYSLTIKYQVFHFVPGIDILEQFEIKLLTILQQILSLLL